MKPWTAVTLAWLLCGLALAGAVAIVLLDVLNDGRIHSLDDAQPVGIVLAVSFSLLGAVIVARQPGNRIGWIYLLIGVLMPVQSLGALYYERSVLSGGLPGARWAAWMSNWAWLPVFPAGLSLFAFLLFPSGRLPSRRWRPVAWLAVAVVMATTALYMLDPTPITVLSHLPKVANPTGIAELGSNLSSGPIGTTVFLFGLALIASTIVGLVVRERRAGPEERQQLKLLAYAAALTIAVLIVVTIVALTVHSLGNGWWDVPVLLGFGVAVPVACGIAIFKHGLYEIDLVINKTVVVGLLAAFIGFVYAAIVVGIGTLAGQRGNPFLSALAAAVVALAFQPLRERARLLANSLVYGKRATPYEALSAISKGMTGTYTSGDGLQRIARLVVEATGAVQAQVWLRFGDLLQPQASWPEAKTASEPIPLTSAGVAAAIPATDPSTQTFPVEHDSELLGAITVKLSPSEPLTLVGERLITDLAAQAGLGVQFERVKERALFARALASFLPPQVAALIEKTPDALALREEVEATILFSDIRGFSTLAERIPAREVAEIAGRHLAAMADVVSTHGGVLDKFAGDAVMAVFGAPNPLANHAECALRCAIAMQQRQAALNEEAEQDHLRVLQIGVGVNTGTVVAGTLGGTGRLDYTVLGDPVNVAQRLQSQASGGEIIGSAATIRLAPTITAEPIGSKQLKGRQELVDAYRIPWQTAVSDRPGNAAYAD